MSSETIGSTLDRIRDDAASETYNGTLDFGHVGLADFMVWATHYKDEITSCGDPLSNYDLISAMRFFERWAITGETPSQQ
jgi:hypothetical protein